MTQPHGNILFVVLLGIILFGALNYTVLRSSEEDVVSNQGDYANANQLIQYGESIRQAIAYVRTNKGCAIEEISFDPPPFDGSKVSGNYLNPKSPADERCHLFSPKGGNLNYRVDEMANLLGLSSVSNFRFLINKAFNKVGTSNCTDTSCQELYLLAITSATNTNEICDQYNRILKNDSLVPIKTISYSASGGHYNGTLLGGTTSVNADVDGKKAFCVNDASNNSQNHFVYVLVER